MRTARRVAPEPFHVMSHHRLDVRLAVLDPRRAAAPPVAAVIVHRNVGVELVREMRRERDEERRVQRVAVRHDQRRPADVRVVGDAATQAQDAHGVTPARLDLVHLALSQRGAPVPRQSNVLVVGGIEHRVSAPVGRGRQGVRRRRRRVEREATRELIRRASRVAQETSHDARLYAVARPHPGAPRTV